MSDRRKWDLSTCKEVYKGVWHWKQDKYILVKDGEHYLINAERLDRLLKQAANHGDEIVRDYKPRARRKKRDPNAPKPKSSKNVTIIDGPENDPNEVDGTGGWIDPEIRDPKCKIFAPDGFMYKEVVIANARARARSRKKTPDVPDKKKTVSKPSGTSTAKKKNIPSRTPKKTKKKTVSKPSRPSKTTEQVNTLPI